MLFVQFHFILFKSSLSQHHHILQLSKVHFLNNNISFFTTLTHSLHLLFCWIYKNNIHNSHLPLYSLSLSLSLSLFTIFFCCNVLLKSNRETELDRNETRHFLKLLLERNLIVLVKLFSLSLSLGHLWLLLLKNACLCYPSNECSNYPMEFQRIHLSINR